MGRRFGIVAAATAKFRRTSASQKKKPRTEGIYRRGFSLKADVSERN